MPPLGRKSKADGQQHPGHQLDATGPAQNVDQLRSFGTTQDPLHRWASYRAGQEHQHRPEPGHGAKRPHDERPVNQSHVEQAGSPVPKSNSQSALARDLVAGPVPQVVDSQKGSSQ